MSIAPMFMIEVKNENNKWERLHLYHFKNSEYKECDLMPYNGMHDLFQMLDCDRGCSYKVAQGIHYSLPKDVSEECSAKYHDWFPDDKDGKYAKYITLADIEISILKTPKVEDWENSNDDEVKYMNNPLCFIRDRIRTWVDLCDAFLDIEDAMSDIRLIYWAV